MRPFDKEHTRRALLELHERGIELTPEQLDAERKKAYATIRREMRRCGYAVPDSDEELFLLIRESQQHKGRN